MNPHDFANMSEAERHKTLFEMSDEDIDYSDIPELDEKFFKNAKTIEHKLRPEVDTISIRSDILDWFKTHAREEKYEDLINDVLESYIYNQKK
ncbi:hypothetical protein [Gloeocapsa sp. PCC 73106]|uniref:hypothetical protein n=1 Tax=Gloeocapsa sp. PCC 73106 TaxID=102232 RepID=UPI0002ACC72E|nr:hypothetical protein [Gloeocapsa sp. PCC 73106]ELS00126.1 hypothetical protein GLO73106DRAFT_00039810 [Gloeocapsa sp. PCC 73106]